MTAKSNRFGNRTVIATLLTALLCITGTLAAPALARAQDAGAVTVRDGAQDPAVSPDGREMAVSVLGRICVIPERGGAGRVLSSGVSWDRHPAWSPDGRFLAYAHEFGGGSDLVIYNMKTATAAPLFHSDGKIGEIAYDSEGGRIFFVIRHGQYEAHIWQIPTSGGEPKALTETRLWHEWSFAPSPDGQRLFLSSGHYGGSNLYLLEVASLAARRLTHTPWNQSSVAWSRDGQTLAWVEAKNASERIFVEPAAGGAARAVFQSPYDDKEIAFEPDGKSLVVCAGRKLYRLEIATGALQPISFEVRLARPESPAGDLVVEHARLIDGTGAAPISDASIVIRDGKIVEIDRGTPAASKIAGLPVLDAQGKTVLPGLMDNHYHFWDIFDGPRLLSRGITYIRDPGADLADSMNFKEAIRLGLFPGPDVYSAGPLIDGVGAYHPMVAVQIDDPAAAAMLVKSLKAQGVDLLKVYFMLKPQVLRAVVQAAHANGLRVTGHIGVKTSWTLAIEDGIDGLNHIRVWADFLPLSEQPQGENESLSAFQHPVARMQADWREMDPDSARVTALIERMARAKIGFDPTLSIQTLRPAMRRELSLEQYGIWEQSFGRMSEFVKRAVDLHVPLLAGTDDGSLFEEMEDYEKAGVPRQTIVEAATANGAAWLGKQAVFGSVQPGRRGDLILVDGGPLEAIRNLRKISVVVKNGKIVFRK
jgi:Tol biopolymer transport system component